MKVDLVDANHYRWMEDTSSDHLLSQPSPDIRDIYGDPEVTPRLGDQYQVEIPSLMPKLDHVKRKWSATNAEGMVECSSPIGLPIPVMWVHDVVDVSKYTEADCNTNATKLAVSENNNEISMNLKRRRVGQYAVDILGHNAIAPENSMPKLEFLDDASDNGGLVLLEGHENSMFGNRMDLDSSLPQYKKCYLKLKCESTGYSPVPGSLGGAWSDIEQESFLLGLYIFGKDLVQVKRFVESKGMGDILSFYYGQFYRSERYHRWSECRKMRSRKSINGQRIFTGWRQQELLSRLLPHVSENCANTLLEVSKAFGEGRATLEEYVSILKGAVGLNTLVEAIAIGKWKLMEPTKTNQVISARSEIPVGKACSSLTSADIVKFLTGNFRLSKARSNDLFWEAVWPRLLASGWHSEQPKNHGYVGTKHSLVFLIPGIKKFSKGKLVKGNHYFDSIRDVLSKVASDPKLLELEAEAVNVVRVKEESGMDVYSKSDQTAPSDLQQPLYLLPKVPNCNSEVMKFTVVDTSLAHGKPYKIRELRSLPVDGAHSSSPAGLLSKSDCHSSEEQVNETKSADDLLFNDQEESCPTITVDNKLGNSMNCMPNTGVPSDLASYLSTLSKQHMPVNGSDSVDMVTDNHDGGKRMKCQFKRRTKSARPNYLSPIPKRQRLNACNHREINCGTNNFSVGPHSKEEPGCQISSLEASDIMVAKVGRPQQTAPTGSSGKCSPGESSGCIAAKNCFGASTSSEVLSSHEKPQPQVLIDLNLPRAPPDLGMSEPVNAEICDSIDDSEGASFPLETNEQPSGSRAMDSIDDSVGASFPFGTNQQPSGSQAMDSIDDSKGASSPLGTNQQPSGSQAMGCIDDSKGASFPLGTDQQPSGSQAMDTSTAMDNAQPSVANGRRQSTRNRPLTMKVLESLESGFFTTRRRGRGTTKAPSCRNTMPRSSQQQAHDHGGASESLTTNSGIVGAERVDSELEALDEKCSSYMNMLDKPQIQSKRKENHDSEEG